MNGTNHYGWHGTFTATAGEGDALTEILLMAAEGLSGNDDCLLYLITRSSEDVDVVSVTEVWTSKAAHDDALQVEGAKELMKQAKSLIAGMSAVEMRPVGGKGL